MNAKKIIAKKTLNYLNGISEAGFGSGSTVNCVLEYIDQLDIKKCLSGSSSTSIQLAKAGTSEINYAKEIGILVDGADQIIGDRKLFIKGGGGALFREKILWEVAKRIIVVAEERKWVEKPSYPIAIEVLPFAHLFIKEKLDGMEEVTRTMVRMTSHGIPFHTDNGNWIIDVHYEEIDLIEFEKKVKLIPGVIETGIFKFENKPLTILTERREVEI